MFCTIKMVMSFITLWLACSAVRMPGITIEIFRFDTQKRSAASAGVMFNWPATSRSLFNLPWNLRILSGVRIRRRMSSSVNSTVSSMTTWSASSP